MKENITLEALRGERIAYDKAKTFLLVKVFDLASKNSKLLLLSARGHTRLWANSASSILQVSALQPAIVQKGLKLDLLPDFEISYIPVIQVNITLMPILQRIAGYKAKSFVWVEALDDAKELSQNFFVLSTSLSM